MKAILLMVLCCVLAAPAHAGIIYKCRQAGGVVSYQDKPCPGRQIGLIRTSAPAPPPKASAASAVPGAPTAVAAKEKSRPTPTAQAPRPSFRCTRPDGSVYFSGDARSKRTLVTLAGLPAPPSPIAGAPPAPPGKAWAQDDCQVATRSDSCQFYDERIAYNDAQQRKSKGDPLRRLTREGQRLRTIRNHRCQ